MGELLEDQLNVAISAKTKATLDEIKRHHRYLPAQIARGLLEAACEFYDNYKWFGFPVDFQARPAPGALRALLGENKAFPDPVGKNFELNEGQSSSEKVAVLDHAVIETEKAAAQKAAERAGLGSKNSGRQRKS